MRVLRMSLMFPLAACLASVSDATGPEGVVGIDWQLVSLNGQAPKAPASIYFEADGRVHGQAPCNRFFGMQSAALPTLSLGPIGSTKRACPYLDEEADYFAALNTVTHVARDSGDLVLSGPDGARLVYQARD
ncbi:MAG: META domain-containing protein [Pelagimonas sp.]|nr:META domain-containing protein [Pelagimonas sp.]